MSQTDSPSKLDLALKASERPEHDKLTAEVDIKTVADLSQAIGEFLDALVQQGIYLAQMDRQSWTDDRLVPAHRSIQDILARYFNIDRDAMEREKMAMLDALRAVQR